MASWKWPGAGGGPIGLAVDDDGSVRIVGVTSSTAGPNQFLSEKSGHRAVRKVLGETIMEFRW